MHAAAVGGAVLIGARQGVGEVILRPRHCSRQVVARGEAGGDGGGKGAAGAVRARELDARRVEFVNVITDDKQVGAGGGVEVAALEQHGGAEFLGQQARIVGHNAAVL